jgi:transcriptional regulator with XRE-family HTH domain
MPRQSATTHPSLPVGNSRLKLAIFERGIKQGDLAARLRISESKLSRIVHGRQTPTDDEQDRIAELLEQPRRKLFRGVA